MLEARYLRRDAHSEISEIPEQLVARAIAHTELVPGNAVQAASWEGQGYTLLTSFNFLRNSSTLMNAGTPRE
jgi:ribonucleoside-diphosphate reductase alpha chain